MLILCSGTSLPAEGKLAQQHWHHAGGAPPEAWQGAPPLADVRRQLGALLEGRILVGHHLRKDLKALGLRHPAEATRDTLQFRCGRCGTALLAPACSLLLHTGRLLPPARALSYCCPAAHRPCPLQRDAGAQRLGAPAEGPDSGEAGPRHSGARAAPLPQVRLLWEAPACMQRSA